MQQHLELSTTERFLTLYHFCLQAKPSYQVVILQSYTYVDFPSETVTRSGYQINQKNFGVAAKKKGMVYTLVARYGLCNMLLRSKTEENSLRGSLHPSLYGSVLIGGGGEGGGIVKQIKSKLRVWFHIDFNTLPIWLYPEHFSWYIVYFM